MIVILMLDFPWTKAQGQVVQSQESNKTQDRTKIAQEWWIHSDSQTDKRFRRWGMSKTFDPPPSGTET